MIIRNIIAALGALYSLFAALSILFGWAQRFGWKSQAGNLEPMLSGTPLKQYRLWRVMIHFAYAIWFVVCFFYEDLSYVRTILLALITAALVGVDKYFRRFATN